MSLRWLLATICLFAFTPPVLAAQVTINVTNSADSGPGSLRAAIIAGNALPGSDVPNIRIELPEWWPILLNSSLPVITKPAVIIRGVEDSRSIIDGKDAHQIFKIQPPSGSGFGIVRIGHLTLRKGTALRGGCLASEIKWGLVIIDDTRFHDCTAIKMASESPSGGAIHHRGSSLSINDSEFFTNLAKGGNPTGGAIDMKGEPEDSLNITNSTFQGNQVINTDPQYFNSRGGAIATSTASVIMTENVFRDNAASRPANSAPSAHAPQGGAISCRKCSGEIGKNTFTMNQAGEGGALNIISSRSNSLSMGNNSFVANTADVSGGAMHVFQSKMTPRNNSFYLNSAPIGSVLSVEQNTVFWFSHSLIAGTAADDWCTATQNSTVGGMYNLRPAASCVDAGSSLNEKIRSEVRVQGYLLDTSDPISRQPLRPFVDSGAVNSGSPSAPDDEDSSHCMESDLLGNPRPVDGLASGNARCDIGAFEWQHEASLFADDFEDRLHSQADIPD